MSRNGVADSRVIVSIKQTQDGAELAYVDGLQVVPTGGKSATDAAMDRVATLASHRGSGSPKTLRVLATDAKGITWEMTVDEKGGRAVVPAAAPPKETLAPAPHKLTEERSRRRLRQNPPKPTPERRGHSAARRIPAPLMLSSARPKERSLLPLAFIIVAVTLVAVLSGAALWIARSATSPVEMTHGVPFPVEAPVGWSRDARWQTPALADDTGRARVIGGDVAAFVAADPRRVFVVETSSGNVRWSQELPDGSIDGGLHATTIDGQVVVAAHVGSRLAWWSLESGDEGGVDLPPGASVQWSGAQPVVVLTASSAAVISDEQLVTVGIPKGATVFAAMGDGTISAASSDGWWQLRPGQAGGQVTPWAWRTTLPIKPDVIAYSGGRYVLRLAPQQKGQPTRVLVYRDRGPADGGPVWSFDAPITPSGEKDEEGKPAESWSPSTSLTWGVLGRTLVNFESETATDLGPWTTTHVVSDRAYGIVRDASAGEQTIVVGPRISARVIDGTGGIPDDLTVAGALVRTTQKSDGVQHDYLLPQEQR